MRNLIYKLFFAVGIFAATFGTVLPADASIPVAPTDTTATLKVNSDKEKLYFSDVINESEDSQLYAAHYSHRSHSSHSSHYSHRSGY
ncbi:MAG: hypothetical protein LBC94_07115 [Desulfovibrio sp.]|jgi:hypothetical protein|nr:hypothetical protein [Desulfovibrio sp.]